VEAFDLPSGGRGSAFGQPRRDPVLAAGPLEQYLHRQWPGVFAGELFSVVGQYFERHTPSVHRRDECVADRVSAGGRENSSDDDEAGMIVDAGEHLAFASIGQEDAADQVELPQVYRCFARPASVLPFVLLLLGVHESIADENAVNRRS
jgi:hypothetical protein